MKSLFIILAVLASLTLRSYGQLITYSITSQAVCTQSSINLPTNNNNWWLNGLNIRADEKILGVRIIAYKLRWFSGAWSDWFVVGVNDLDTKYNTATNSLRRMWSYFDDHQHQYIFCK